MMLTSKAIEKAAKALAEATNGGQWEVHYTAKQRCLWERRVISAMSDMVAE